METIGYRVMNRLNRQHVTRPTALVAEDKDNEFLFVSKTIEDSVLKTMHFKTPNCIPRCLFRSGS